MRRLAVASLVLVLIGVGCGGGGGGGDGGGGEPTYDLNGWWELAGRETGSGIPFRLSLLLPVRHVGSTVEFNSIAFTQEGSTLRAFEPSATDPNRTEWALTIISNDHVEGVTVVYSGGAVFGSTDVRMLRIAPPSGILTVNGTVGTTPVSVSSTAAYGLSSENAGGPTFQISIFDFLPDGGNVVFLRWDQLPPIGAATYVLGGTLSLAGFGTTGASAVATAGSVTIVSFNANHVSGSYLLTLDGGGTITGTFDVDILIQN